jgi:hypothetical protein
VAYVSRVAADPWDVAAMAADVRAECRRAAASLAVVDYMLPGALVGAEAAGVPAVALVHTLYGALLGDGDFPGPMAMAATVEALDAAARALGAAPVGGLADLLERCARVLVTCPASLDECPERWPANVRHVGPVLEAAGDDAGWSPPPGDCPLVAVSLGTTPMGEAPVMQGVLDGLAGEPVRVAVAVGAHLDASALDLPANATATGYVRHAAVLPHAAAGVNHGGLGTVPATLGHRLPQVCVPLGREQPHNARAVARRGVGLAVDPAAGARRCGTRCGTRCVRCWASPATGRPPPPWRPRWRGRASRPRPRPRSSIWRADRPARNVRARYLIAVAQSDIPCMSGHMSIH